MKRKQQFLNLTARFLAVGLILGAFFTEHFNNANYAIAIRSTAQNYLALMRSRLEGNIYSDIQLVKGLVSVIAANPHLNQEEFARAAQPLFQGGSHLRNIGAAPDLVIRMMYPMAGNEKAIGLDYRKVPTQLETVERTRQTRKIVLAGPISLVQGGNGLISEMPIFIADKNGQDYYWGQVSTVIDTDRLYLDSGLTDTDTLFEVAIRGRHATGPEGEVFFGRAEVFKQQPVVAEIPLPQGSWQMAVIPRGGWPTLADNAWQIRTGYLLFAILVLIPFFVLNRALRANSTIQAQLSATLENSPCVAVQWYNHDGQVVYWNQTSELLYGWSASDAKGKTIDQLNHSAKAALKFLAILANVNANGKAVGPYEISCHDREGKRKIMSSTVFSIPSKNAPLFVRMDIDITERKQAEREALLAKEAAESASRAKSDFLASMSHELRTPLNAIMGFAQLLELNEDSPLTTEQQVAVKHILTSSRHLLKLINEVLDLARIESGNLNMKIEAVKLSAIFDEAVPLLRPAFSQRGISIVQTCHDELYVRADASRLRQVLFNLLSNAIKYNRENGQVSLSCFRIGNFVRISVTDTGMGIPEEQQKHLFQPFHRLGAEKSNIEGTGVGLAVCKQLMEAMEGKIGFESTGDAGCRFWIDIPSLTP